VNNRDNPVFWVAVILATGMAIALNIMTFAALWVALSPHDPNFIPRLGENATQVLTGWGGGIMGVLGAYIGYAFGNKAQGSNSGEQGSGVAPPARSQ
jgi:hypothetical protein